MLTSALLLFHVCHVSTAQNYYIKKKRVEDQSWKINWCEHKKKTYSKLQHWLTRFILKVRKQDGSIFTPTSLHHIAAKGMRHLWCNERPDIDIFRSSDFSDFRTNLDAEMKQLQAEGISTKKKQAQILTIENEI